MSVVNILFAIVPLGICLLFLLIGVIMILHFIERRNFVPVPGRVVECSVVSTPSVDRKRTLYSLDIVIQYEWNGKSYSKAPSSQSFHGSQSRAAYERRAAALAAGTEITIFCNAQKPGEYALSGKTSPWEILAALFCLAVGFGGPVFIIWDLLK